MQNIFLLFSLCFGDAVHDEVPGHADDAVALDHEEPGHHEVVAVGEVPQRGGAAQQAGAAVHHVVDGDVVILVQLDQTQLVDAGADQEGLLLLQVGPRLHPPLRLGHALRDELDEEEARGGGGDDEDPVVADHEGAGVALDHDAEARHVLGPGGGQGAARHVVPHRGDQLPQPSAVAVHQDDVGRVVHYLDTAQ